MKILLTGLIASSLALGAASQTMWRDAPMQASQAEIRALMPQASETSAQRRASDPSALLEIASTPIAGENFSVTYHFESDRLQSSRLIAKPEGGQRMQALLNVLQASLRKNYGLPVSTKVRPAAALGAVDLMWAHRAMTVQLLMLDGVEVALVYRANPARQPQGL